MVGQCIVFVLILGNGLLILSLWTLPTQLLVHGLPHGFTQMMISSIVLFYLRIYSNLLLNFVNMVFSMIIYPKPITKTGVMTLIFIIAMTLLQKISLIFCIDFSF